MAADVGFDQVVVEVLRGANGVARAGDGRGFVEGDSVDGPGNLDTGEARHGRNDVDRLHWVVDDRSGCELRPLHKQRNAEQVGLVGHVPLAQPTPGLETCAVVGGDDHGGRIPDSQVGQSGPERGDECVDVARLQQVSLARRARRAGVARPVSEIGSGEVQHVFGDLITQPVGVEVPWVVRHREMQDAELRVLGVGVDSRHPFAEAAGLDRRQLREAAFDGGGCDTADLDWCRDRRGGRGGGRCCDQLFALHRRQRTSLVQRDHLAVFGAGPTEQRRQRRTVLVGARLDFGFGCGRHFDGDRRRVVGVVELAARYRAELGVEFEYVESVDVAE